MNKVLTCLLILFGLNAFSQSKTFLFNDTLFVQRNIDTDYYHALYIESNPESEMYTQMTRFRIPDEELENLKVIYGNCKQKKTGIKVDLKALKLPQHFLPVYSFEKQLYLYRPSDWGNLGGMSLSDSCLIHWNMDGLWPDLFQSVSQINKRHTFLSLFTIFEDIYAYTLTISCIDEMRGLYLWEYGSKGSKPLYCLYADIEKARSYPIFINYSKTQKEMEFLFEEIDPTLFRKP